ncbi:MAG: DUF1289 domain-containing protein [Moraxella sp.]|nr:DUF1289 domain-containing protein [Moraxella sp.]
MPQIELFDIDNPCIGVCQTAKNGYCIGCLRSRTERQNWYQLADNEKHRVLTLLAKRRKKILLLQAKAAKQGRQMDLDLMMELYTPDMFGELP